MCIMGGGGSFTVIFPKQYQYQHNKYKATKGEYQEKKLLPFGQFPNGGGEGVDPESKKN